MRSKIKFFGIAFLVILVFIQFIRPAQNLSNDNKNSIGNKYPLPDSTGKILRTSCYDCHSNYTVYPWYANVQPVGWWLTHHINEGNQHLNFSAFLSYRVNKQYHLVQQIKKQIQKGDMPLSSYTLIHTYAKLNAEQSDALIKWSESIAAIIKSSNPADSLVYKEGKRND